MKLIQNITMVCRKPEKDGTMHAYPIEKGNTKALKSAKWWATQYRSNKPGPIVDIHGVTNNVKVIDYNHRKSNTVFKVLVNDKYIMDLRDRHLLEIMQTNGIHKGGIVMGDLVFCMDHSIGLIPDHGTMYEKALLDSKRSVAKFIPFTQMSPGNTYVMRSGKEELYLGNWKILRAKVERIWDRNMMYTPSSGRDGGFNLKGVVNSKSAKVFLDKWRSNSDVTRLRNLKSPTSDNIEEMVLKSSSSFIECKKGKIKPNPKDIREGVFKRFLENAILKDRESYKDYKGVTRKSSEIRLWNMYFRIIPFSKDEDVAIPRTVFDEMKRRFPHNAQEIDKHYSKYVI